MSGASKANQRQSRTHKRQYDNYKNQNRYARNKCRKMLVVLARNPNDENARAALIKNGKEIGKDYAKAAV
jgi:hypothetical protein